MSDILTKLNKILVNRMQDSPEDSYVAGLYQAGTDKILRKIGEESVEAILAVKQGNKKEVVHEVADLWFHTLVLLVHEGLSVEDVLKELEHRFGTSGLIEKAGRANKK